MSVEVKTVSDADRQWRKLAGEKEELGKARARARRDADIDALYALADRERDIEREMRKARAASLAASIRTDEEEHGKVLALRQARREHVSDLASELRAKADEMAEIEAQYQEANFNLSHSENRLHIIEKSLVEKRREMAALVEVS